MSSFRDNQSATINQINKEYQIYFLLVTMLVSLQLICNTIEPIIVSIGVFTLPASAVFYVLSFAISDILTENFGFRLAVRASLFNAIAQFIFCGIATAVYFLPKEFESSKYFDGFSYLFHFISLELIGSVFSLLISMIANDYIIDKLKHIFLGKGFWWRTIVSTIIGELIMLNIDYNITFFAKRNFIEIQKLIINAMEYKILAAFILAIPSSMISKKINKNVTLTNARLNCKTNTFLEIKDAFTFS